jgi:hypothetical protein
MRQVRYLRKISLMLLDSSITKRAQSTRLWADFVLTTHL